MLDRIIRFFAILFVGLLAGHAVSMVLTIGPTITSLEAFPFLEVNSVAEPAFASRVSLLFVAVIASLVAWMIRIRRNWKSKEFAFVLVAIICMAEDTYFTFEAQVPLNDLMSSWKDPYTLPGNWKDIRMQWYNFMYIHAGLLTLMFILLLLANHSARNKKSPLHQRAS